MIRRPARFLSRCVAGVALACTPLGALAQVGGPLTVSGPMLVDRDGNEVRLSGPNLGAWLLIETWMLGLDESQYPDQFTLEVTLRNRFGAQETERLLDVFRLNWMTQRDFDRIASLGFNAVRIPLDHALFESSLDEFLLREDAFEWTDRALLLAERAGLYVVFDMHGVPGGQSVDQPSGRIGENNMWGNEGFQERLAWIWQHIARRYLHHQSFAGYDILNEPYGDFVTDHRDELIDVADRVYRAIREIDADRPIFMPGALEGIRFYEEADDVEWEGVGYTEHFYPGVFDGEEPSLGTFGRFWSLVTATRGLAPTGGAPYILGEFNPLWDFAGGPNATRAFFDRAGDNGWSAFNWAWKRYNSQGGLTPSNWSYVTNSSDFNFNPATQSANQIESLFRSLSTQPLAEDGALLSAIAAPIGTGAVEFPAEPAPLLVAPSADALDPAWTARDVGDATAGGQSVDGNTLTLFGAGVGVDKFADSMRTVTSDASGDFTVTAVLEDFDAPMPRAGTGVSVRAGDGADAAAITLVRRRNGAIVVDDRSSQGGFGNETTLTSRALPVGLGLSRQGNSWTAWITDDDGAWQQWPLGSYGSALDGTVQAGVAVTSNDRDALATGRFTDVSVTGGLSVPAAVTPATVVGNLVPNASFEAGTGGSPTGWLIFGSGLARTSNFADARSGSQALAYTHASGNGITTARVQFGGLVQGERYRILAPMRAEAPGGGANSLEQIEVRLQTAGTTVLRHESLVLDRFEIDDQGGWFIPAIEFVALDTTARLELLFTAGPAPRAGRVLIDDVSITQMGP